MAHLPPSVVEAFLDDLEMPEVTDAPLCPICLEEIWPVQEVSSSMCVPVPHVVHIGCWNAQTEEQKERCCVCRQLEINELDLIYVGRIFHIDWGFPPWPTEDRLPPLGREILGRLARGVITRIELYETVDNDRTKLIFGELSYDPAMVSYTPHFTDRWRHSHDKAVVACLLRARDGPLPPLGREILERLHSYRISREMLYSYLDDEVVRRVFGIAPGEVP